MEAERRGKHKTEQNNWKKKKRNNLWCLHQFEDVFLLLFSHSMPTNYPSICSCLCVWIVCTNHQLYYVCVARWTKNIRLQANDPIRLTAIFAVDEEIGEKKNNDSYVHGAVAGHTLHSRTHHIHTRTRRWRRQLMPMSMSMSTRSPALCLKIQFH